MAALPVADPGVRGAGGGAAGRPRQPPRRRAAVLPLRHAQGAAAADGGGVRDGHGELLLHARAHPRAARRQERRRGQRHGRQPGHRHAVLLLLGGAAVHRLRAGRRAAGRDLLVPDLGADGQRGGAGAAVRPVRLEDRRALPGPGPGGRHRRRLGHRPAEDGSATWRTGCATCPGWRRRLPATTADLAERIDAGFASVREIVGKVWPYILVGIAVGAAIHGYVPRGLHGLASWARTPGGRCRWRC